MNLEVLFHSASLTGNNTLRTIATRHADTTMKNHIRADGELVPTSRYLRGSALSIDDRGYLLRECCSVDFAHIELTSMGIGEVNIH